MTKKKFVYFFGNGKAEGSASMKDGLGGKGANLAEMTNLGLPFQLKFASYITKTEKNTPIRSKGKSPNTSDGLKNLWVKSSAMPTIRFWCRSVRVRHSPCRE